LADKDKTAEFSQEENIESVDAQKDAVQNSKERKASKEKGKKEKKEVSERKENGVNTSKYDYVIKNRRIRQHQKQQRLIKIMLIFLSITIVLGGGVYGMLTMLEYNNFKVLIDKEGKNILSLSPSESFTDPTEVLALEGPRYMDNITLMDMYHLIPEIEATDGTYGEREKKNYVASTFYLKNVSSKDQRITEAIVISDVTKNVDDALRIMVIRNSERTIYAKARKDGEPEEVVPGQFFAEDGLPTNKPDKIWMSVPFASPRHVFYNTGINLAAGEVIKYTILIWLEGWDPECINDILGGTIKLEFQFSRQAA
jgi:hypothetical protein